MGPDNSMTCVSCPVILHHCATVSSLLIVLWGALVLPHRWRTHSSRWVGFFLLCPVLSDTLWKACEIVSACLHEETQWVTKVEGILLEKRKKNVSAGWGASLHLQLFVLVWQRDRNREGERWSEWVRKNANWVLFLLFFLPQQQANWICYQEFVWSWKPFQHGWIDSTSFLALSERFFLFWAASGQQRLYGAPPRLFEWLSPGQPGPAARRPVCLSVRQSCLCSAARVDRIRCRNNQSHEQWLTVHVKSQL